MQEVVAPPGRGPISRRLLAIAALIVIAAVAAVVAFRNAAALAVLRSTAHGFGYHVAAENLDVNLVRAAASNVHVSNAAGEPVLDARQVDIGYSLRDLLPGGKRLFGLTAVTVVAPHVTVIHHPDGSYNITFPSSPSAATAPNTPPLDVRLHVTDGSVEIVDRFAARPRERRARLDDVHADGVVSPAAGSYYHAGAVLDDGGARYPIVGNARFEDPLGFEYQHWTAATLPIAMLADFALKTHAIVVQGGELRHLDLKLGALRTVRGTMESHLGISAQLRGGRVASSALTKPVRDARGSFVIDGDSATVRSLDADLDGIKLHARGALYHFAAPQVAFALTAHGDLNRVRELSKESAKLPLRGAVTLAGFAEGPAANPLVFARVNAPRVDYGTYRLNGGRGFVAISGSELDLIAAAIRYGPVAISARASLALRRHTQTSGYAVLDAPADGLPYAANIVPGMVLRGTAVVNGTDAQLAARGFVGGATGADRLDVPFSLDAAGSGRVGPVVLQRRDGAVAIARARIDRAANQTVALADIHRFSLLPAKRATLPGLTLPAVPAHLDAKLDATLTGIARGSRLAAAGGVLHVYGKWGDLRADADGSATRLAARGRLTTSFDRLAAFTGNLGGRGDIDVPFALTNGPHSTIVQIQDARFRNASIRGISLQGADATLGIAPPAIDVYAADLRVADRQIAAAGRLGGGGRLGLTAGDFNLRALRAAGVPVSGGRATVLAELGGTAAQPTADVLAAFAGATYARADLGGNAGLAYAGGVLRIDRATVTFGGAYATATGRVTGLTPGRPAPRYALRARLEDADIATLARTVKNPLRYPAGTLDADVRVAGAGARPTVRGDLRIPEGSINGLYFRDGAVGLNGDLAALSATGGRVTVGGTTIAFSGSASRGQQRFTLRAPRLDLADFNDYFDEADVLAGTGSIALTVAAAPRSLETSANVALAGTRYLRYDLGAVNADVRTAGTTIRLGGGLNGSNGRLNLAGTVDVPAGDPLRDIVRRSNLDLQAQIAGINLSNVLPAAGVFVPLLGMVDGSAVVRGRYPALALSAHAALTGGVAGRVPIDRFTIAATAAEGRGRLTELTLAAAGLTANATGTFGLRPADAFDLRAQASAADIDRVVTVVTGKSPGVRGTFTTRAHLTGTAAQPRLTASLDVGDLSYSSVTVPSIHADLDANRSAVDVRNGNVALRAGSIAFDAHAPFGGGAATPIALDFAPHRVDVNPYSSLLPNGSVLDGLLDGNVGVRGTLAAPRLTGNLDFSHGSYRSKAFTNALTDVELDLGFAGTSVRIARLHAHAAPGNIDGSGSLTVRDLRDPIRGLSLRSNVTIANAYFALPAYYTGYVDGTLSADKRAAAPLQVAGNVALSSARIPYTALLPGGGASQSSASTLPDVGFDVGVSLTRDVRIQSGPVDIGTTGMARLGGTLAEPTLAGRFTATDGTVSLYRTFTVQNGSAVSFNPSDGITPSVDATAVTNVPDPPTDVLLRITGLSTHLQLAFSSQPTYSQEQILGLLVNAQALGAVSGIAQTGGSANNGVSIAGLGEGVVDTQLTQKFLQPFSSKLGGALGLSDLNLNYNLNGSVAASARRRIGKNISFVYGEQIGGPTPQTSVGINVGTQVSGAQLTFYQAAGSSQAFGGQALTPFLQSGFLAQTPPNYTLQAIAPPNGSGFVFSYQRRFW